MELHFAWLWASGRPLAATGAPKLQGNATSSNGRCLTCPGLQFESPRPAELHQDSTLGSSSGTCDMLVCGCCSAPHGGQVALTSPPAQRNKQGGLSSGWGRNFASSWSTTHTAS